ncbi:MAG TPA: acyltransferase, partial [Hyphomonadaceae bacterium]|nr:acyltransferase [Hyphomonadaceae bacterium]
MSRCFGHDATRHFNYLGERDERWIAVLNWASSDPVNQRAHWYGCCSRMVLEGREAVGKSGSRQMSLSGASGARADSAYRRDIDGLRAIAVTSVVLYHAGLAFLPGGFVGVDIFFVISGYLIGGILLREVSEKRFKFTEFYARRARRILPALIVVVLAASAFGLVFLTSMELKAFSSSAISALAGVANIRFWQGTGYFTPSAHFDPLLMTWSLGVEEQFYVVFPFLLLAI